MTLKDKVAELCKEKGLTMRELERKAELKERTIQHWDKSQPNGLSLYKVATVLEVPIEELLAVYDPDWERIAYVLKLQEENDKLKKEIKKIPVTNSDGQMMLDLSKLSEDQREAINDLLKMNNQSLSVARPVIESLVSSQQAQDDSQ